MLLALRSEGAATITKTGLAITLLRSGKLNPLHIFGEKEIEGHKDLVKMIKAAQAANKE